MMAWALRLAIRRHCRVSMISTSASRTSRFRLITLRATTAVGFFLRLVPVVGAGGDGGGGDCGGGDGDGRWSVLSGTRALQSSCVSSASTMAGRLSFSYKMCTLAIALRLATRWTRAVGQSSTAAMDARKAGNLGRRLGPGLGTDSTARAPAPGGTAAEAERLPRRSHCDENESHRPRMACVRPAPALRLRPMRSPFCRAGGSGFRCCDFGWGLGGGCCALDLEFLRAGGAPAAALAASLGRREGAVREEVAALAGDGAAAAVSFLGRCFSLRPASGASEGWDEEHRRCGCCWRLWWWRSLITPDDARRLRQCSSSTTQPRRRPASAGSPARAPRTGPSPPGRRRRVAEGHTNYSHHQRERHTQGKENPGGRPLDVAGRATWGSHLTDREERGSYVR